MKKIIILILGLLLTAASCDFVTSTFDINSGVRGVFRSEDAGSSYRTADNLANNKGDIGSLSVNAMSLDPTNPNIIYLASSSGVYKSEDGAKTWRYILSGITTSDVSVDPFNSQIIYAAGLSASNGKIIKSYDGGTSWVDIYTEPSKNNTVLSISVANNNSSIVLAGLNSGGILRSTDAGHTWQVTKELGDRVSRIRFGVNGSVYVLAFHNGAYVSSDLGVTWKSISATLTTDTVSSSSLTPTTVSAFYDLALDKRQAGVVYLGTEQGLFRTINDGADWTFIKMPVKEALRVSSVAVEPNNSNSIYAAIDSTVFKTINGSITWETKVLPTSFEVRTILIDPQSNNVLYLGLGIRR